MSSEIFRIDEHVAPTQHIRQYPRATSRSQEDVFQLAVKQYTPRDNSNPKAGDVTILACHASGFPKELYEPMWDELYRSLKAAGKSIRSIWIADVYNQGYSGVLNEHKLGNDPSYYDHARDMLLMVNHFRDSLPRPLIGLGHSMGGTAMINLALMHPRLFSTIVIIEPIVESRVRELYKFNYTPYLLANKTDLWPSREEAINALRRNPLCKSWDPAVRSKYEEHGLRQLPTAIYDKDSDDSNATTMMTTKDQELFSYARPSYPDPSKSLRSFTPTKVTHPDLGSGKDRDYDSIFYRPEATLTFAQLPFLRPTCLYIYGCKSHLSTASEQTRRDKLSNTGTAVGGSGGAKEGAVKEVVTRGGHFVAFEYPKEVANIASGWMAKELERWMEIEEAERQHWAKVELKDRARIDDNMRFWMKKNWKEKPKPAKSDGKQTSKL